MKISVNWINQLLDTNISAEKMAEILTATGLEVEGIEHSESIPGGLKGLVTGEVLTCEKHPDADRLKLTTVNTGSAEPLQIVCGASNVAAGQKVIVATPGTTIYPASGEPFTIKESKIRGQKSSGMICAEDEIGLGESHEGIMVLPENTPVGKPVNEIFNVETDDILEIGLTPNRADAASHIGVARDLAAFLNMNGDNRKIIFPPIAETQITIDPKIRVEIDSEDCIRYSGIYISGVEVKESPEWLANRLSLLGMRPVNNIVDITNLVMLETGQPLHAFDADKIRGNKIVVRKLNNGTTFKTLEGKERKLSGNELMICDSEGGLCLAGVFGGADSGVNLNTKNIFLESACFDSVSVRKTSKEHGLKTDSSFRFERGTDPNYTLKVLQRALHLINEIAGGSTDGHSDNYPIKQEPYQVKFSPEQCDKITGVKIDREKMKTILLSLGICVTSTGEVWDLEVPRFKVDVTREIDVIEEILRIYGYDNVPLKPAVSVPLGSGRDNLKTNLRKTCSLLLNGIGFTEMMNNSLTSSNWYSEDAPVVKILNPLSQDLNIMRYDMLVPALQTIAYNKNRQQKNLHFYEFGFVYSANDQGKYRETEQLALITTGNRRAESWEGTEESGFFYLKGIVNAILEKAGADKLKDEEGSDAGFDWCLKMMNGQKELALIGKVKSSITKKAEIEDDVYYAVINWGDLVKVSRKTETRYSEIPKFPRVRRDLALLVNKDVTYSKLREVAGKSAGKLLNNVFLFDVYEGKNLPEGKMSYAIAFEFQDPEKTLTDQQIDKTMEKLLKSLETETGATIRS